MEGSKPGPDPADVKQEINGISVSRLPTRDAYSHGLRLLDILFTKEELAGSLLFSSKKSNKPGLDSQKVEQLLNLIERRYGNDFDIKH